MHVFATSAAERTSAGPKAATEAGLLGVVQLSRVVERCHNVPLRRGMDRQLVATTPRADTTGSRALSSAWRQARDEKVIAREDGYTYIAALRSPDLRHTTKREGDTSVTVVTSNSWSLTEPVRTGSGTALRRLVVRRGRCRAPRCCLPRDTPPGSAHTPQEPFSHALLGQRARRRLSNCLHPGPRRLQFAGAQHGREEGS